MGKNKDDDIIAVGFDYDQDAKGRTIDHEDIPEEEPSEEGTGS